MAHREAVRGPSGQNVVPGLLYQCACCEGIIVNLSGETTPSGLDLKLNFIADECLLICNACTSRLVEIKKARPADRRR